MRISFRRLNSAGRWRKPISRRTRRFAGSAGRKACWSSRKLLTASRGGSASRRRKFASGICIAARARRTRRTYGQEIEDNRIQTHLARIEGERRSLNNAAAEIAKWNADTSASQARPGDDAGEVWHFLHAHASEPGRRAGFDLSGRHRAGESRRDGNGPGRSHEHRHDCGEGTGRVAGQGSRDADQHGQSAEHVRHGGVVRHGFERHGGEKCVRDFARAAGAGRAQPGSS